MALQTIVRIKVSGAGLLDINGNYDVCNSISKFPSITTKTKNNKDNVYKPEFMYVHLRKISSTQEWEYALYLQPVPEMGYETNQMVWVLARVNVDGDKHNKPIILYCAARKEKINIPPATGWNPVGGIEPCPQCQFVELQIPIKHTKSPLRKAIDEANKDDTKLEDMMFDRTNKANAKMNKLRLNKNDKNMSSKKQYVTQPRSSIFQPGSSKDMRRVRGE